MDFIIGSWRYGKIHAFATGNCLDYVVNYEIGLCNLCYLCMRIIMRYRRNEVFTSPTRYLLDTV